MSPDAADHDLIFHGSDFEELRNRLFGDASPLTITTPRAEPSSEPQPTPSDANEQVEARLNDTDDTDDAAWAQGTVVARSLTLEYDDDAVDGLDLDLDDNPAAEEVDDVDQPADEADDAFSVAAATIEVEQPLPDIVEPEVNEPEAVEPEAVEPEAVEPEAVEPEAVEPEAVEPALAAAFVAPVVAEPPADAAPAIDTEHLDWTQRPIETETDEAPPRRRALFLVAVVVVAAVLAASLWLATRDNPSGEASTTASGDGSPAADGTAQVTAGRAEVTISNDLGLSVSQQVVLNSAASSATISLPDRSAIGSFAKFSPQASNLQIVVDGETRSVADTLGVGDSITVDLPPGTTGFELSYQADGAVVRSKPSSAGRALVLADVLSIADEDGAASVIAVDGALNMGCITPTSTTVCGESTPTGWQVDGSTEPGPFDVLAQVNLPD